MCAIIGSTDSLQIDESNYATVTLTDPRHVEIVKILLEALASRCSRQVFNKIVDMPLETEVLPSIRKLSDS